ncbi:MAG: hypothetical protein WAU88_06855 [Candidatus Zixiibacteriota bacterium]
MISNLNLATTVAGKAVMNRTSRRRRLSALDDIAGISTEITEDEAADQHSDEPVQEDPVKNAAAVSLGRLGGLKGGNARAKSMTRAQRSNSARVAATARWRRNKKKK